MGKLIFKDWLEEQGIDSALFWENCKEENRGERFGYTPHISKAIPQDYVSMAFAWEQNIMGIPDVTLMKLAVKWLSTIQEIPEEDIELGLSDSIDISKVTYEKIQQR